jgi:biotin synthase
MLDTIINKSLKKINLNDNEFSYLINFPLNEIEKLIIAANKVKNFYFANKVELCSIINAKSGRCQEDCKFCAQSAHYNTNIEEYDFIDTETIKIQAKRLKEKGVKNFSIVTSGTTLEKEHIDKLIESIKIISSIGLLPDISVGILDKKTLKILKDAGCYGFHHNLETSESFFPNMCSTHDYIDDVNTVKNAVEMGYYVCSGGIFGLGENWKHRIELALTLKSLNVDSIPINFLTPIKGTPFGNRPVLSASEALKIVAVFRLILPDKQIRVCGGRNTVFSDKTKLDVLKAGASGIMVGNYLTQLGFSLEDDIKMLKETDFEFYFK